MWLIVCTSRHVDIVRVDKIFCGAYSYRVQDFISTLISHTTSQNKFKHFLPME